MYQSIDDDPDDLDGEGLGFRLPVLLALLAVAAVFAFVYVNSPGEPSQRGEPLQPEPTARAAYLRAIGETDPALRRARLTDFVNTNPEDPRAPAAQSQLHVLNAEEARAWQATVDAAYDNALDETAKRDAVERFKTGWGRYLGGRDTEVAELLAYIEGAAPAEPPPDRSLPERPSSIPQNVPADSLAGAPATRGPAPIIIRPSLPRPSEPQPPRVAEVVPPRIRRNVTPRYPRKAQRRGVSGIVTLSLDINRRGRVDAVELVGVEAERYADDFVKAAERAALRTRFFPKTVGGETVDALGVRKRYRFESDR